MRTICYVFSFILLSSGTASSTVYSSVSDWPQISFAEPQGGFALALRLAQSKSPGDGPLLIATLKNASNTPLTIWRRKSPDDLELTLFRDGAIVPQTRKLIMFSGLGPMKRVLPPGETTEYGYALGLYYNMTPGSYELKAKFHLRDRQHLEIALPESNVLKFQL